MITENGFDKNSSLKIHFQKRAVGESPEEKQNKILTRIIKGEIVVI